MGFNPLQEKGIPIEQQLRNWSELNVQPYNSQEVHPYSRTRVITMNGVETESILFSHQFARHTAEPEIRQYLAQTRRIEQQQQKAINWLTPGDESTLRVTIGYEQVAVDLTAYLARTEPDPYLKQAFEFGMLEDFDHLYRYANLLDMLEGKQAEDITGQFTEIMPGRATADEHRHPIDDVRKPSDRQKADPLSLLHVMTLVATEQQTMNFYMNVGNRYMEPLARGLYLEIAQIEEQHVTHYESMLDPNASWFERDVMHQYNECYLYYSFMQQETDPRLKQLWELHLNMEIAQLQKACEMMRKYEQRDPESLLPKELPEPFKFQENKDYIRQVLESQVGLTGDETQFVPVDDLPPDHRYFQYQQQMNGDGIPSEQVIHAHEQKMGKDYRFETEGKHPVGSLRA